ncbi:hypothetical protein GCM10007857_67990 [Bradyrhizobium iriomotense]|uniref:Uncharacterized protein n=1 Tax=Bradyrhizobium iriomotense TaxID=441950 RepID=A0ABQ6BAW9_9BRAD|nr:hypothetical protein GCM10007857_67990 [Bradyrhizobium iriomotense]
MNLELDRIELDAILSLEVAAAIDESSNTGPLAGRVELVAPRRNRFCLAWQREVDETPSKGIAWSSPLSSTLVLIEAA